MKTKTLPSIHEGTLVAIIHTEPKRGNLNGYCVGLIKNDGKTYPVLFPHEEFPIMEIHKFNGKTIKVIPTEKGLRTSIALQEVNDATNEEILAIEVQDSKNEISELKEKIHEILDKFKFISDLANRLQKIENSILALDFDLNKFRGIFWSMNNHSTTKD